MTEIDERNTLLRARRASLCEELARIDAEIGPEPASPTRDSTLLRGAFNASDQSILVLDLAGRVVDVNRVVLMRSGYTREQLVGRTFEEMRPAPLPGVGAGVHARVMRLIREGEPFEEETLFQAPQGGIIATVRMSFRPVRDERDEVIGVLIEGRNVTAQRAAERSLGQREAQLRSILDDLEIGVFSVAADTHGLVYANPALERIIGRSIDEIAAPPVSFFRWMHPDDQLAAKEVRERRLRGESVALECRLLRPDGETRWIRSVAHSAHGADGTIERIDMMIVDRTEQHLAAEAIERSERRFRSIVARGWDIVSLVEASGNLLFVSDSVERILGFTPDEVRAGRAARTPTVEALSAWASVLEEPSGVRSFEMRAQTKDGRTRWLETALVNLLDDPDVRAIVASARDITARKEAEQALAGANADLNRRVEEATAALRVTNAELATAARAKDEFLANMSHELRTPLNGVLGLVEGLEEHVYGPITARQRATLGRIGQSGRHLLALLTDILDLAKIEAGKEALDLQRVAIADVCNASLAMVEGSVQRKGIRVSVQRGAGVASFRADGRKVKQILVNLLGNAVKFTPEGGEVGLDVALDPEASSVRFTVWDRGIGIADGDIPRLFQPFTQIESSLARSHKGSGLGLALVRRLVELHGGAVEVESEVGRGSRFTVRLPMRDNDDAMFEGRGPSYVPPLPMAEPPSERRMRRILVADDDEINVDTVVDFLRTRGYDVFAARDGREAVDLAREIRPDVILMDIQMPVVDGLQAIRELRADPCTDVRAIPIVALTALAMESDRERCLKAGADDYMSKPVGLRQLANLLEDLLNARVRP